MEKLLAILGDIRPDVDFRNEKNLIDDGILDSVDILTMFTALSSEYHINIPATEIIPENFNSIESIYSMIQSLAK